MKIVGAGGMVGARTVVEVGLVAEKSPSWDGKERAGERVGVMGGVG